MKINSILNIFTPKDVKFFPMLNETADILQTAATYLEQLLIAPKDQIRDLCLKIKKEELKGDAVSDNISSALNDTFITPFDREDIHALSDVMDDVIDGLNRTSQKVLLYEPEEIPKYLISISNVAKEASDVLKSAIYDLPTLKKNGSNVREYCNKIKSLEEKADIIYEEGIINLFHEKSSTVELIKLKEILLELELSINKINSSAKVLKTMVVKYA